MREFACAIGEWQLEFRIGGPRQQRGSSCGRSPSYNFPYPQRSPPSSGHAEVGDYLPQGWNRRMPIHVGFQCGEKDLENDIQNEGTPWEVNENKGRRVKIA